MDRRTSRRATLRMLTVAPVGAAIGLATVGTADARVPVAATGMLSAVASIEPAAGTWRTFVLASGSELRLAPPPDAGATAAEIAELQALESRRDGAALDRISYWDAGSPTYRWSERAVKHAQSKGMAGARAQRVLTLLSVAIYDGMVAAWDSKYAYSRARPANSGAVLSPAIATPSSPSYPDEHAVAAGAAATVLSYIFPADAEMFAMLASEAAGSRAEAGVAFPSDTAAGLALGRQVGERVVTYARTDGSDAAWTGSVPTEPGKWTGTNPAEPMGGTWKPWALTSVSQFRPDPPPAPISERAVRDLTEVKNYPRTNLTNLIASYWEYFGGRAAFEQWNDQIAKKIFEYRVEDNPPRAASVYALVSVAVSDALIACWDAKYAYWAPRPQMMDPTITTVFATPNHPSYPSAHSVWSGAASSILGRLFPRDAAFFKGLADQAGEARIMGGIHCRIDCEVGSTMGQQAADVVWSRFGPDS